MKRIFSCKEEKLINNIFTNDIINALKNLSHYKIKDVILNFNDDSNCNYTFGVISEYNISIAKPEEWLKLLINWAITTEEYSVILNNESIDFIGNESYKDILHNLIEEIGINTGINDTSIYIDACEELDNLEEDEPIISRDVRKLSKLFDYIIINNFKYSNYRSNGDERSINHLIEEFLARHFDKLFTYRIINFYAEKATKDILS